MSDPLLQQHFLTQLAAGGNHLMASMKKYSESKSPYDLIRTPSSPYDFNRTPISSSPYETKRNESPIVHHEDKVKSMMLMSGGSASERSSLTPDHSSQKSSTPTSSSPALPPQKTSPPSSPSSLKAADTLQNQQHMQLMQYYYYQQQLHAQLQASTNQQLQSGKSTPPLPTPHQLMNPVRHNVNMIPNK